MASGDWVDPQRAGAWIGEVEAVRSRARRARRGTWFPLALFGLVVLGATPVFCPQPSPDSGYRAFPLAGSLGGLTTPNPTAVAIYWMVALPAAYVMTVMFYRWRARHSGVTTRVTGYVATGITLFMILVLITWRAGPLGGGGLTIGAVPLLALAIGLFAYAWVRRSLPTAVAAAVVLLPSVPLGNLVIRGLLPIVTIALGLFALAWIERSVGLLVFAGIYLAETIVANLYNIENLAFRLGFDNYRISVLINLWVLGASFIVAAGVFWLTGRTREPRE